MNKMYTYECKCNLHHGLGKGFTDISPTSKNTGIDKYFTLQDAISRLRKDAHEIKKDGFVFMNDNPLGFHRSEEIDDKTIIDDINRLGTHMTTMISKNINSSPMYTYLVVINEEEVTSPLDAFRGVVKSWQ